MSTTYDNISINHEFQSIGQALQTFAEESAATKGAGFAMSYGATGEWRISIANQWMEDPKGCKDYPITRVWKDVSLYNILKEATEWIIANRKEIIVPIKKEYTL